MLTMAGSEQALVYIPFDTISMVLNILNIFTIKTTHPTSTFYTPVWFSGKSHMSENKHQAFPMSYLRCLLVLIGKNIALYSLVECKTSNGTFLLLNHFWLRCNDKNSEIDPSIVLFLLG